MTLLAIAIIAIPIHAIEPCIHSYLDHKIDYITNHINTDSFIYYLGKKASTNDCQSSCIHLNYLCDKSLEDMYLEETTASVSFDNDNCEITASYANGAGDSTIYLTSDLVSREYIIEAQITVTFHQEVGIFWKTDKSTDGSAYVVYGVAVDGYWKRAQTFYETSADDYVFLKILEGFTVDTKYNLTVHMIGTQFTTYVNGEVLYSDPNHHVDESIFKWSYAGLYSWSSGAIFHSFKIRFPDATDNQDAKVCAAYTYDKIGGSCYGYYGSDYAAIESSLVPHTSHDSAVLYDSTCDPTTSNPTPTPTQSLDPTVSPVVTSNPTQSRDPTISPVVVTSNPTPSPTQSLDPSISPVVPSNPSSVYPTAYGGNNPSVKSTPNPTTKQDARAADESTTTQDSDERDLNDQITPKGSGWELTRSLIIVISILIFIICVVILGIFCSIRRNKRVAKKIAIAVRKAVEDDNETVERPTGLAGTQPGEGSISGEGPTGTHANINAFGAMQYPPMANNAPFGSKNIGAVNAVYSMSDIMDDIQEKASGDDGVEDANVTAGGFDEDEEEYEYYYEEDAQDGTKSRNMRAEGDDTASSNEDHINIIADIGMGTKGGETVGSGQTPPAPPPPLPPVAHGDLQLENAEFAQNDVNAKQICFVNAAETDEEIVDELDEMVISGETNTGQ